MARHAAPRKPAPAALNAVAGCVLLAAVVVSTLLTLLALLLDADLAVALLDA